MTMTKTRQRKTKIATAVTMATVTPVDSHAMHLLLLRNMQLDPVSSQIHLEHNLPVVPSAQSLQEGETPDMPDS